MIPDFASIGGFLTYKTVAAITDNNSGEAMA
jgi:hypothetical protein